MTYVVSGTSNTLLPGLGGSGYKNTQPINFGAISSPKSAALNNAKTAPPNLFSIAQNIGNAATSFLSHPFGAPAMNSGQRLNQTSLPSTKMNTSPSGGAILPQPTQTNSLGSSFFNQGMRTPVGQSLNTYQSPAAKQPIYSPSGGAIIPQYSPPQDTQQSPQNTQQSQPANVGTPQGANANPPDWYTQALEQNNPTGYAKGVGAAAIQGSPVAGIGAAGLISSTNSPLVQGLISDYQKKAAEAQQYQQSLSQGEQNLTEQAVPLTDVEGEKAAMERNYGIHSQALAAQAANALNAVQQGISEQGVQQAGFNEAGQLGLTGQGLLQSGLTSASQLTQPSSLYSPYSLGQYPVDSSGQPVAGGIQTAINNATLAGVTQGNISQITDYASAASSVSGNVNAFDSFGNQALSFMSKNGINPFSTGVQNQPVMSYLKTIGNPSAAAQFATYMIDLKNTAAALSQAKGITPSAADAQVLSTDPSNLSGPQLQSWIQTVHNLGTTYHNQLAQNAQGAQSANQQGGTPYTGNISPSSVSSLSSGLKAPVAPPNAGAKIPPWEQFLLGIGTSLGSALSSVPTAIASGAALKAGEALFASLFL